MYFLAFRYLLSKKKQTLLILIGVVLGTSAYVAVSGMMLGFQKRLFQQLVENDAHIRISSREEEIEPASLDHVFFSDMTHIFWFSPPSGRRDSQRIQYPQGWFDLFQKEKHVKAYSPQLNLQVLVRRAHVSETATFIGSNPDMQLKVANIQDYMVEGKFVDIGRSGSRIVIGKSLLKALGARVGETIFISSGKNDAVPFKIIGIYDTGIERIDSGTVYGSLIDAQKLNQTASYITDIAVRIDDVTKARLTSDIWRNLTDEKVMSWDQVNAGILSVFKTQNIVRNSMTISILVVASFGIYNILNMLVTHKRHEIAILRSVGYSSRDVLNIFLIQGLVIGTIGGLVGLLFGYAFCSYLSTIQIDQGRIGLHGRMVVSFDFWIYVRAFSIAFFSCALASLLPARAAGKLTPIEVIRSE